MKISGKQKKRLWGYSNEKLPYGPYSEVQIITETRIIDDHVSRTMMFVEAHINPLTFEIVTANADKFDERDAIEGFLTYGDYRGDQFGYVVGVSPTFEVDPNDKKMMTAARRDLEVFKKEAETTIIKMHKFVMKLLDISPTT